MKTYLLRLLAAALTFSIGAASIYLFARYEIKTPNPPGATRSSKNNSPYSLLEGRTVRLKPYDATFDIPEFGFLLPLF